MILKGKENMPNKILNKYVRNKQPKPKINVYLDTAIVFTFMLLALSTDSRVWLYCLAVALFTKNVLVHRYRNRRLAKEVLTLGLTMLFIFVIDMILVW